MAAVQQIFGEQLLTCGLWPAEISWSESGSYDFALRKVCKIVGKYIKDVQEGRRNSTLSVTFPNRFTSIPKMEGSIFLQNAVTHLKL
jgi:hypothetical protein